MSTDITVVEGEILDGSRFPNLYLLLDLERSAMEEAQRLSMPAAFEVLAAFESDEWRRDKRAEHEQEAITTNLEPRWGPETKESFYRWMQEQAERDGHSFRTREMIRNLKDAAECYRIARREVGTAVPMPENEWAWRPAAKLLNGGWTKQIGEVVELAASIAEEEGKPVTQGIMLAARSTIWRTDPEIRQWVEQPNQTVDPRSPHDRVVTALNRIRKEANDLRKVIGDNPKAWNDFLAGLAEIQ